MTLSISPDIDHANHEGTTRMKATRLLTTASIGALIFGMSAAAHSASWRYAHEEYQDDVQDVFAHAFKDYIEENSDNTVQVYRFGELGESDTSWSRPRRASCSSSTSRPASPGR